MPTEHDREEIAKFAVYLRQVGQAKRAGVPSDEAQRVIHDEVYEQPPHAAGAAHCAKKARVQGE